MNKAIHIVARGILPVLLVMMSAIAQAASLPDFTELVKENSAAVVNIATTQRIKQRGLPPGLELPDIPEDSPLGDFLRRFFGEGGPAEEFESQSLGSGFIVDAEGYVVTNYHVIKNATEIIVRLQDRRELEAKVVGSDERSDIALLKINAHDLPVVKFGKSADLEPGEWVMAIGSPFGFDHSVSVGVVSAVGRNLPSENYVPFIQTDVAINPGNSGGPLFNLNGEVVGINSQIYSRTGGFMGLSFAIPADLAVDVIRQLKTTGKVERGMLGILIQDVDRELAESFGMDQPHGAVVLRVLPGSPAEAAGLKVGDVVVEFNGQRVGRSSDLPLLVGRTPVGKKVKIKVIRGGKKRTLRVKIGALTDELAGTPSQSPHGKGGGERNNRLGIEVAELSAQERKRLEVDGGVRVVRVHPGAASRAGIRPGDVILQLNGKPIDSVKTLTRVVKKLPKDRPVPVLIQRGNSPVFLAIRLKD
ncbi:MAG TPA: DegQ family serine endoprotease [Gammaproteobacteria bacterium]|nr:DegQ family serine endoprotease [Gammaproteobacteria bacterium]